MSQSGAQAAAFFRDVPRNRTVWFVQDEQGSPAPRDSDGTRSLPFWSTSARATRAARVWGHGLWMTSMPLEQWREGELPSAAEDGLLIGINWSGPRLVGWSFTVAETLNRLVAADLPAPHAPSE
ncbi:DUF2750 domain-containing protein [Streptomyces pini]|uniref:DUF2750 domain-containing protein n=1 Tax=Streptomyces pini TaxID=1520580 RepID=UPI000B84422A|nr:DUF2750 domain-containing protein [Streptomyces pini]